ncbi:MAG: pyridoxal phosphate-dependent decarboxylase family protein [Acidimicrobiia bacterium]
MHRYDARTEEIAQLCFDYAIDRLRLFPVPLDGPLPAPELERLAGQTITRAGRSPEEVMALFADVLAPACVSNDSPKFLAFIPGAPTKASQLFDVVVSASSIYGGSWMEGSGAVYAENQALRWVADLAGLPDGAGGCFVSGGSAANLSALVAARESAARRRGDRPARWRVAVGDQAHSSLDSTIRIMDALPLIVPTGDDDRLHGSDLRAALDADPDPGSVFAVVGTGGTTNTGQIDDLEGIAAVARERELWFHVDGAYGLAALAAPSVRGKFRGVEHADSLVVDPHKWLFAPFDCAALLYRDPELARLAHTQHAAYLDAIKVRDEWNPSDYAYHLSRRARGLPFWFSLAVHGTDAYSTAIERTLDIAQDAARRIDAAPHLELVRTPELGVVLWRRPGWTTEDYTEWSRRLLADERAFLMPTTWRGETLARAVFLNPECPPEIVDDIIASMQ